jgi:peptide-methionine (R)-S-oxide reductase
MFFSLLLFISCKSTTQQKTTTTAKTMKKTASQANNSQENENNYFSHLDPEQYRVLKEKGTESPFSGQYNLHFEQGTYACAACNTPLFESGTKFDGHCGWPSFDKAIKGRVKYIKDNSHGMIRTEIVCAKCGGHLGHIFDDGPTETGKRYCVNSLSLSFEKDSIK